MRAYLMEKGWTETPNVDWRFADDPISYTEGGVGGDETILAERRKAQAK